MSRAQHAGPCTPVPAKRGSHEVCSVKGCNERFPCAGNDCGHLTCVDERGRLPVCGYCGEKVEGPVCGIRLVGSRLPELDQPSDDGTWTMWSIRGRTKPVHYSCRSANSSPADRARWGESLKENQ